MPSAGPTSEPSPTTVLRTSLPHLPGLYWGYEENTAIIRQALQNVRKGTRPARILIIGDSITAGSHTGSDGLYAGAFDRNFTTLLGALLEQNLGLPVSRDSFLGENNVQGDYGAYNTRVLTQGAFVPTRADPHFTSIGGAQFLSADASNREAFVFVPSRPADDFELRLSAAEMPASIRWRAVGYNWRSLAAPERGTYVSYRLHLPVAARHQIEITRGSGPGSVSLHGLIVENSGVPSVELLAAGFAGSTAARSWIWNLSPWSPLPRLEAEPADLKLIALGANDLADDVPLDDFIRGMREIIIASRMQGDVIVMGPPPQLLTKAIDPQSRQDNFRDALIALCKEQGVPFYDQRRAFGIIYSEASRRGLFADSIHPNSAGAAKQAEFIADLFALLLSVQ